MLPVPIPVLVGAAPFQEGGSDGVAFVLDLSEQKRAEAESQGSEGTGSLYSQIYAIPDLSGSRQRKEGRWAAFSTTPTAGAIGFDVSVCARLPCWQPHGPRSPSTQGMPPPTTSNRRSRRQMAFL